jgi:hypothetical protein
MSPSSPAATISRMCRTIGYPVYVYVTPNSDPFFFASAPNARASALEVASGLSHTTCRPFSSASFAIR